MDHADMVMTMKETYGDVKDSEFLTSGEGWESPSVDWASNGPLEVPASRQIREERGLRLILRIVR